MTDKILALQNFPLGNGRMAVKGQPVPLIVGFDYEKAARKGFIEHVDGEPIVNPAPAGAQEVETGGTDADEMAFLKEKLAEKEKRLSELQQEHQKAGRGLTDWESKFNKLQGDSQRAQQEFAAKGTEWEKQRDNLLKDTAAALERENAYKEVLGGELLPEGFPARAALFADRRFTVAHLQGMDKQALDAIPDIGDKLADQILAKLAEASAPAPEAKK